MKIVHNFFLQIIITWQKEIMLFNDIKNKTLLINVFDEMENNQ